MNRKPGRPTIFDVADLSGVSKSTVSNVIRNTQYLSEDTRDRVQRAIEELGYRPNVLARDLKLRRSTTIGVVVGNLSNPFYSRLTRQIEQLATGAGYAVIISDTDGDVESERKKFELLIEHRVAGVLLLHYAGSESVEHVKAADIPVVGVSALDRRFDYVVTDDAMGTRLAVEHLVALGHRDIAFVASPFPEMSANSDRESGWRATLGKSGLEARTVLNWDDHSDQGLDVLLGSSRPTAFVAATDVTALDLMDALEARGLSVPRDVSIVGYDDISIASHRRLSLTTVSQNAPELAESGFSFLLELIENEAVETDGGRRVRLRPTLVVRGSTGPPG